jgi:hypothetical protein
MIYYMLNVGIYNCSYSGNPLQNVSFLSRLHLLLQLTLTAKYISDNTPANTGSQDLCKSQSFLLVCIYPRAIALPVKSSGTYPSVFGFAPHKASHILRALPGSFLGLSCRLPSGVQRRFIPEIKNCSLGP